jgi:Domain of unknown function (DUF1816)
MGILNVTLSTKHKLNLNEETSELHWWLEIGTIHPICIYFFGPFEDPSEAESSKEGFSQDLEGENARLVYSRVKLCKPRQLTIERNELTIHDVKHSLGSFLGDFAKRSEAV